MRVIGAMSLERRPSLIITVAVRYGSIAGDVQLAPWMNTPMPPRFGVVGSVQRQGTGSSERCSASRKRPVRAARAWRRAPSRATTGAAGSWQLQKPNQPTRPDIVDQVPFGAHDDPAPRQGPAAHDFAVIAGQIGLDPRPCSSAAPPIGSATGSRPHRSRARRCRHVRAARPVSPAPRDGSGSSEPRKPSARSGRGCA